MYRSGPSLVADFSLVLENCRIFYELSFLLFCCCSCALAARQLAIARHPARNHVCSFCTRSEKRTQITSRSTLFFVTDDVWWLTWRRHESTWSFMTYVTLRDGYTTHFCSAMHDVAKPLIFLHQNVYCRIHYSLCP
jgi:hypothetical protein